MFDNFTGIEPLKDQDDQTVEDVSVFDVVGTREERGKNEHEISIDEKVFSCWMSSLGVSAKDFSEEAKDGILILQVTFPVMFCKQIPHRCSIKLALKLSHGRK